MKTKVIFALASFALIVSVSSCKKCYKCTEIGGTLTEEYCKPSSVSYSDWKVMVDAYEANGYNCK